MVHTPSHLDDERPGHSDRSRLSSSPKGAERLEPIELARHFTRAIATGDIEAVRACYSEDAQI
jgi:hypothetical protein